MEDAEDVELRALLGAAEAALVQAVARARLEPEVAAAACATLAGEYAAVLAAGRRLPPGPVLDEAARVLRRRGEAVHRALRREEGASGRRRRRRRPRRAPPATVAGRSRDRRRRGVVVPALAKAPGPAVEGPGRQAVGAGTAPRQAAPSLIEQRSRPHAVASAASTAVERTPFGADRGRSR
jgi:hypothetical protein